MAPQRGQLTEPSSVGWAMNRAPHRAQAIMASIVEHVFRWVKANSGLFAAGLERNYVGKADASTREKGPGRESGRLAVCPPQASAPFFHGMKDDIQAIPFDLH
jgi:hypothetical protein